MGRALQDTRGRRKESRAMTPAQAKEHLLEVAASGIVTRTRKYVEIQLDCATWDALQDWKRNDAPVSENAPVTVEFLRGIIERHFGVTGVDPRGRQCAADIIERLGKGNSESR